MNCNLQNKGSVLDIHGNWFLQHMQIGLHNTHDNPAETTLNAQRSPCAICRMIFCFSGAVKICALENRRHRHLIVSEDWCSLQYISETCRFIDLPIKLPFRAMHITLSSAGMGQLLGTSRLQNQIDEAIRSQRFIALDQPLTPAMRLLTQQVEDACGQGQSCTGPFVMAKGLELLWHFSREWENGGKPSVNGQDRKAVGKASRILEKNLAEPPSLVELASQVGMSLTKFKEVFRQYYEMPPYAYLRKVRMEKAMCLLQLHGVRVTETAFDVGYNSVSHFAKTFAAYFGMSPSDVRKRSSKSNKGDR
jgi:AraC-like DNA-binding protein